MSLKTDIETQVTALEAYDAQDFDKAIDVYLTIADTSKIHTNIGLIYATLGEHEAAVDAFNAATELDQYLAVAYFQCGVSNFLLGRFEFALKDFEDAFLYLRNNENIDYEQLGLKFKLYSAEVLFNLGLSRMYLGEQDAGLQDLRAAARVKVVPEHDVIDDAIRDRGEEYTVFSIPVGILFRPPAVKVKNAKTKDYLGKAKLISVAEVNDAFTTFTGVTRARQGKLPSGAPISELNRSNTMPAPPVSRDIQNDNGPSLTRSATAGPRVQADKPMTGLPGPGSMRPPAGDPARSLSVPSSTQPTPDRSLASSPISPSSNGLTRQNTTLNVKPLASAAKDPPQLKMPETGPSRLTEIYDDYLDSYAPEEQPPLPPGGAARVMAWANKTDPRSSPSRAPSTRPPPSAYGGSVSTSASSAGGMRRKDTRRRGPGSGRSRSTTNYDEESEEGYASGDYDDAIYELTKIRVKIHYNNDVRGMTFAPELGFDEFVDKVAAKFGRPPNTLSFKFKDEEGTRVSLIDESDYDLAIETARESAKGKPEGKLEVWCMDEDD